MIFEGPFSYEALFAGIGNVQLGVAVPPALAGVDQAYSFDIDKVGIIPEPTTLLLLAVGAAVTWSCRRRGGSRPR